MIGTRLNISMPLSALLIALLAACGAQSGDVLVMEDAWVRDMPPGVKMTAAYFTLHNRSTQAIDISGFTSPQFKSASLHETKVREGVSSMVPIPRLVIEPGASVELKPGGLHVMLMGRIGDEPENRCCTLHLERPGGEILAFEIPVRRKGY